MKKLFTCLFAMILLSQNNFSQFSDSVYLSASYSNQSYYNLNSGEVSNVDNNNWDLAFSAAGGGASIRINGQSGVILYNYPNGDTSAWTNLDTAGINNWNSVYNSDISWASGAFNINASSSNPMDLGWGIYSTITHHVTGDSINVIKLSNGSYKKIQIIKLSSGNYDFKYADIDGSNEVITSISKSNFTGKNFGYYSLVNGTEIDREPLSSDWHIVFTKYITTLPSGTNYGVTGVLTNKNMEVAKVENVDVNNANPIGLSFQSAINTVGYNWKSFNMGTFSYDIQDSLCYFIKDLAENIWKLQLTDFEGSSTGKIVFNVEGVTSTEIEKDNGFTFNIFPSPSNNGKISFIYDANRIYDNSSIDIFNINGNLIRSLHLKDSGFNMKNISLEGVDSGIYIVSFSNGNDRITKKLVIN